MELLLRPESFGSAGAEAEHARILEVGQLQLHVFGCHTAWGLSVGGLVIVTVSPRPSERPTATGDSSSMDLDRSMAPGTVLCSP